MTVHLPYIDPTSTLHGPHTDPTLNCFFHLHRHHHVFYYFPFHHHHHISIVFFPPPPPPHFYCFPSTTSTTTFLLFSFHHRHHHTSIVFPPPPPPRTKHLAVVKKNSYVHAPISWIKQRSPNVNAENLTSIINILTWLTSQEHTKWLTTSFLWSQYIQHYWGHRRHKPSLNMCEMLYEYNKDLHRKTRIPAISFPARYASRTSGMLSSLVLTDWKHTQT